MSEDKALAEEIMVRIERLAGFSESKSALIRRYLTPEHRQANDQVMAWMEAAGMAVTEDAVGNVIGRYEAAAAGAPAVMIGSHLDTVVDAGRYDGMLGVLSGIAVVQALQDEGRRLPFAVEVAGFADEEGARFQSTFLGSRALTGSFEMELLERRDADGISMAEAMTAWGLDTAKIETARREPKELAAYIELHIEQGPVLEAENLPVGNVSAISGATRLALTLKGQAGHAGTVPMSLRSDALAAASEAVLAVEKAARAAPGAVGTVDKMEVGPGAVNVIPGEARFTIDFRAAEDEMRKEGLAKALAAIRSSADRRGLEVTIEPVHEASSVACDPVVMAQIDAAIAQEGYDPLTLPSGAGHDASAMAALCPVGMIFLRCEGGISHHPAESITEADALAGLKVLRRVIENYQTEV